MDQPLKHSGTADNPSGDGTSPPASPPKSGGGTTQSEEGKYAWLFGLLVWVAIIAAFVVPRFRGSDAHIILQVSPTDLLGIEGVVLYQGTPVKSGYVQLTLDEPKTKRFLGSTVVAITNQ